MSFWLLRSASYLPDERQVTRSHTTCGTARTRRGPGRPAGSSSRRRVEHHPVAVDEHRLVRRVLKRHRPGRVLDADRRAAAPLEGVVEVLVREGDVTVLVEHGLERQPA